MATSSDNDDRAETDSSDSDDAGGGDTGEAEGKTPEQKTAAEPTGGATEGAVGRKLGASTSAPGDKGKAIGKPGRTNPSSTARGARAPGKRTSGAKGVPRRAGPPVQGAPMRPKGGSLAKSVILFIVVVGGLAAGFAVLGRDQGGGRVVPSWKVGQTVDVEITLVKNDQNELLCASAEEIAGRHCGHEAPNKPWSKPDGADDKKLLKPYTTTNGAELLAAGLWSEPSMKSNLPATRFSVKCKFTVEGIVKKPAIRWGSDRPFYDSPGDWFAGPVSACVVTP
jgi:hypothetical protein